MSTITKYAMVKSVKAFNTASKSYVSATAQIKMEIANGNKKQVVAFGYARTGGRGLFMTVDGKNPVSITKRDFLDRLRTGHVQGIDSIIKKLSSLSSLHSDKFIVAKCECCGEANVTAANMDFMQRNYVKLAEKLDRKLTAFSKVCYACQGKGPKVVVKKQTAEVNEVATPYVAKKPAAVADCASCGKGIDSKRIADYSIKQYGVALCFGKCQNDAKKASAASLVPTCKTCSQPSDTLHATGNCENCWADLAASEASLPYAGHVTTSMLPFPEVEFSATKEAAQPKKEMDAELAAMSYAPVEEAKEEEISIDTTDLNALLDADAQVLDFMMTEEPVAEEDTTQAEKLANAKAELDASDAHALKEAMDFMR